MKTSWSASQCIHWMSEGHCPQAERLTFLPGRIYSMHITNANNIGFEVAGLSNMLLVLKKQKTFPKSRHGLNYT